jgi:hypothetical protein
MERDLSTISNQDLAAELVRLANDLRSMKHELHVRRIEMSRRLRDGVSAKNGRAEIKDAVRKALDEPRIATVSVSR